MIKAVIFDVDGTLVDTVDIHARAWQDALDHVGRPIEFSAIRSQIGKGGDQLLPVFLSSDDIARWGEAIERRRKATLQQSYLPGIKAFPRVAELFRSIRGKGKRIALASSAKADELDVYKKVAAIEGLCDVETSSDDAERSKPHPDIFQAALQRLDLPPSETIVIGDTPYDAQAARKAGIASIGLLCGGFPADDMIAAGSSRIYADPAELLERLEDWLD